METESAQPSRAREEVAPPIVVVSECLGFAAVRYNGAMLRDDFVAALARHVRFVPVCPEVGIGLGVPRDPIRIVVANGERRLVQPSTGRDLTESMRQFAGSFLERVGPVDGFILKSRSPSCGIKDVKMFTPAGSPLEKGAGFFAEAVRQRFPQAAVEDEGRLTNFRLRHHFLVRVFASARLRRVRQRGTMAALVRFHTEYKLQLMAYSQAGLNALGRIVANPEHAPAAKVVNAYSGRLAQTMAEPARPASNRNVLLHAFGYVSDRLSRGERGYFLELLEEYRRERLPLSALLTVLRAWIVRFEESYLSGQKFFEPYPRALMDLADSARAGA